MADKYDLVTFGEICVHSAFGPRFSSDEYASDGNVACLRTMDMDFSGRINFDAMPLAKLDLSRLKNHILRQGDLVITRTGAFLGKAAVFSEFRLPVLAGAFSIYFRLNRSIADPLFVRYVFNSSIGQTAIASIATGSAQPNINIPNLHSLELPLPSLPEQRAIASILGSLDDKIELNRRMNETLEGIARALFKSWFVDFDPVRAKMDGRQPAGMSPEIANLFPSEFEHVNGELVPKGWTVPRISEVAEINYGKNLPGKKLLPSGIPVYGAAGLVGYYSEAMFKEPVTLVTSRGSGSGVVHQTFGPSFVTNNSFTVVPRQQWLGRHYLRHALLNADILSLVTGSAQPQLTVTNFSYLNLLIPAQEIARKFDSSLEVLWNKATSNNVESEKLASLRDTLLPKLLSGELRVPEADKMLEEVL